AWRMNRDAGTIDPSHPSFTNSMNGGHWGNAGNWSANAQTLHYTVDNRAEVGAVAQWNKNECKGCKVGHVAYVESINPDGSVNLSEYNFKTDHAYDYRPNVPASTIGRFIHITTKSASSPTFSGYTWDRTPTGGQPFNGTITGTNFVVNGTSVFF